MILVQNEYELPGPDVGTIVRYVRSESAARILVNCNDGRCFARVDGNEWDADGYEVIRRASGSLLTVPKSKAREPQQTGI